MQKNSRVKFWRKIFKNRGNRIRRIQTALTLIVKFLGYELDRLPGKLIHQKIMGTYSVILKLGS